MTEQSNPSLWFLTVDWCYHGKRGIFCDRHGHAIARAFKPADGLAEADKVLGPFALILAPEWQEFTAEEVKAHSQWHPLGEYRGEYGYACKE